MRFVCTLALALILAIPVLAATDERGVSLIEKKTDGNRVALVIGNSRYHFSPLKNPANDARAMGKTLRRLGFEVEEKTDLGYFDMNKAVESFGKKLRNGGVGLFYYAGHGMQVNGANYLIPVDAQIEDENEVRFKAVDAGLVLAKMEQAKSDVNIVILDACRDNPFSRSFRSSIRGLASMDAPSGTFIAYATAPGKTAADGDGKNGLFTGELVKVLETPAIPLEQVFKRTLRAVREKSGSKQTPWVASNLEGEFYFIHPPPIADLLPPPVQSKTIAPEQDSASSDNSKQFVTLLKETVHANPDHLQAHRELASLYKKDNKLNELEKEYREILRLKKDDFETRNALTSIYVKNKNYDELLVLLKENVEISPQDSNQRYKLGLVYEFQKDFANASLSYLEAVRLKEENAKALNALGRINMKTGRIKEAKEYLEKAQAIDPGLEETKLLLSNIKNETSSEPNKTPKKDKKSKSTRTANGSK